MMIARKMSLNEVKENKEFWIKTIKRIVNNKHKKTGFPKMEILQDLNSLFSYSQNDIYNGVLK